MLSDTNLLETVITATILLSSLHSIESHVVNRYNNQFTTNIIPEDKNVKLLNDLQEHREALGRQILSLMDVTADPCDDFYEYACGNWDKNFGNSNNINPGIYFYLGLRDELLKTIEKILTNQIPVLDRKLSRSLTNAQEYYKSCLGVDLYKEQAVSEYIEFIKENIGFPAVDQNWDAGKFNLAEATANCDILGANCLFKTIMAEIYPFCPILAPKEKFGLESNIELKDFKNEFSSKIMTEMDIMRHYLELYGADKTKIDGIIDDMMKFGKKLIEAGKKGNESNIEIIYMFQYPEYNSENFNWTQYYQSLMKKENVAEHLITLFKNVEFFTNFSTSIIEKNDMATIANYLSLKALHQFHVEKRLPKDQKQFCLQKTKIDLSFSLAAIYKSLYNKETVNTDLMKLFNELKEAQIMTINSATWFDEDTRRNASNKVKANKIYMGYIDDPILPELLKLAESMNVTNNYYMNNINSYQVKTLINLYHYLRPARPTSQPLKVLNSIVINASYNRAKNTMQINAASFYPPLYHENFPNSLKYGGIGQVIAHEMSHAFDIESHQLGSDGNLTDWWPEDDNKIYEERTKCFVKQYNEKYFPEVNLGVNGTKTLSENIADNGGLKIAYLAYKNVVDKMSYDELTRETLPHTDLNHIQTFFIAHAQKYCLTHFRKTYVEDDSLYPFMKLRVTVPLENMLEFSRAFNCPVGSKMNPNQKCSIF